MALDAYDRMIGLDLADGAITQLRGRGPGRPVDCGEGGMKRSTGIDGYGISLGITGAGANRHDCATPSKHVAPNYGTTGAPGHRASG